EGGSRDVQGLRPGRPDRARHIHLDRPSTVDEDSHLSGEGRQADQAPRGRDAPQARVARVVERAMLRLSNVEVIYDDVILVLKGLSLEVPDGKIVALLGANGAGKTTTLKAVSGLLKTENGKVTDGSIEFMGRRIDGLDPEDICRR